MRTVWIASLAGLALASCNQGPTVSLTNATPEEVAKAADATSAFKLRPGKWEHNVKMVGAPDLPPGISKELAAKMLEPTTVTSCISPEESKLGVKHFLETPVVKQMKCTFGKAEIGGGTISTEMSCNIMGIETVTRSTGTYSETEYAVDGEQTKAGSDKVQRSHTTGKWVGECDAADAKGK